MKNPKTLQQAIIHFAKPENCLAFMVARRWPNGVVCPTCASKEVRFLGTRGLWECRSKHPRKQFSVKIGTIFEDSPISLDKWLVAMWMIANCKNGVSSYEIAKAIGVTQKSAWFMLHRLRLGMQNGSFLKLGGPGSEVEADETFIGGAARFMHRRDALLEYDPVGFEPLYTKHYEGEAAALIRRRSEENSALLLQLVYQLRKPQ